MEFYSAPNTTRPVRSAEATRRFAYESMYDHRWGLDTKNTPAVPLDDAAGFAEMSSLDKYDLAIRRIAENAPVRICENEMISGAATLGNAIFHQIPVTFAGNPVLWSVSHITVDFPKVLRMGINGIRREVEGSLKNHTGEREVRFLESCVSVLDSFEIWHGRYLDALRGKDGYRANYEALERVPFDTPRSFYEAVQSIWFTFAFIRLCGNWPGFGRLDVMLQPYLRADLDAGVITLDEAREILSHFFIKGCEWICGNAVDYYGGDAQHYQNIVLSGIDADGCDVTCDMTYLILDVLEEFGISDFPTTVRLNKNTDEKLLRRVAEVIRYGGGVIALYDEETVIDAMVKYGYPLAEARCFANDGCWETQVPGKTFFSYYPFDSLALLWNVTLAKYDGTVDFPDFDSLLDAYCDMMDGHCRGTIDSLAGGIIDTEAMDWKPNNPCTVVSLFEEGCIRKGRSYTEGGPEYNVESLHIGGLPDTANALYAIKKLVFDDKKVTFGTLTEILRNDWNGAEALMEYARSRYVYYGNDNDEVDMIARRILNAFADGCVRHGDKYPLKFPAGVSTFGRQVEWSKYRPAVPHGYKAGKILAGNLSPTPGTDTEGATAVVKSYCKCDLVNQTTGAALDISLLPSSVKGDEGLDALVGLMRGFVTLGGSFMQIDVTDAEILKLAQEHPDDYPTLSVRVSGWNARFVTLGREWQDMIIERDSK